MIYDNKILKINNCIDIRVQNSAELADLLLNSISTDCRTIFIHLNCCNFYDLRNDIHSLEILNRKITYLFEGIGMKLFSWLLLGKWLKDCNGTDSFPIFVNKASKTNYRLFLLGATEGVILQTIAELHVQYPNLQTVGHHSGYFDSYQEEAIVKKINESKADILIIGRGMDKELEFIQKVHLKLQVNNIWCVGGLFDFVSHHKPRAPFWIRKIRGEWLFRILIEPNRFSKMFKAGLWTFLQLLKSKINYGTSL